MYKVIVSKVIKLAKEQAQLSGAEATPIQMLSVRVRSSVRLCCPHSQCVAEFLLGHSFCNVRVWLLGGAGWDEAQRCSGNIALREERRGSVQREERISSVLFAVFCSGRIRGRPVFIRR